MASVMWPLYFPDMHFSLLPICHHFFGQVRTQRGVPIASQLRSHKLFSTHFPELALLADSATLYHTGANVEKLQLCVAVRMIW